MNGTRICTGYCMAWSIRSYVRVQVALRLRSCGRGRAEMRARVVYLELCRTLRCGDVYLELRRALRYGNNAEEKKYRKFGPVVWLAPARQLVLRVLHSTFSLFFIFCQM